jgi:hypothetical protein
MTSETAKCAVFTCLGSNRGSYGIWVATDRSMIASVRCYLGRLSQLLESVSRPEAGPSLTGRVVLGPIRRP